MTDGEKQIVLGQFMQSEPVLFGWCYLNAAKMMMGSVFHYYEGIATHDTPPESHAWVTINGKLVDVTWSAYGVLPETSSYIGIEIPRQYLIEYLMKTKITGPFVDDYRAGWPILQGREGWAR
jgi:hypothetical protein